MLMAKQFFKNCPRCNAVQTYGRKDHFNSAVLGEWLCKSCANHDNTFKGRIGPMPITWFETKRKSGLHRGYVWDITPEDIITMWNNQNRICALSGTPIGWAEKGLTATVSIDRIDSSEGYLKDNIQLLHKDVNMMKQAFSQEYFISVCKAVADQEKW